MKMVALAVRFLLELAAFAALVYTGIALAGGVAGVLLGIGLFIIAAVAWGLFVAPRARIAAPVTVRLLIEIAVFAAACGGLLLAGRPGLAALLAGVYALDRLALWAVGAPTFEANPLDTRR